MAHIERTVTVTSPLSPAEVLERVIEAVQGHGVTVARVAVNQADFRRGSQAAIRIKGAMFTKIEDFPVVAVIRADDNSQGSTVVINCLDDFGFGVMIGATKKYTLAVEDFGARLYNVVIQVAG